MARNTPALAAAAAAHICIAACAFVELEEEDNRPTPRPYVPPIPYNPLSRFSLVDLSDILCYHLMRFTKQEIYTLLPLIKLERIRFRNRYEATPEEALAVLLVRLSYPTRFWQMMERFGHSRSWLSVVFNDTMIYLYRRYRRMLAWDETRLTLSRLKVYSCAIFAAGGGHCFWGYIDGTLNATCRPILDQKQFYSGHKRKHGYKYQAIVTPDGLVSSLMGPFIGRRGDWGMVEESGLVDRLRHVNNGLSPALAYYLYGDPAYSTVYGIMGPYKRKPGVARTPQQSRFNKRMAKLRIEVEHGFAIHQNLWTYNGFHLSLKLRQGAAMAYAVAVLMANIWTCMRGNQTSRRLHCAPPNVEEYLSKYEEFDDDISEGI